MSISSETWEKRRGPRLRRLAQVESLMLAVLDEIASALERGMHMESRGVGVRTGKQKGEWQGRNPRTGETVVINPHSTMRFRMSELLLARLSRPSERRKSDPRQLAFSINAQQGEPIDTHTHPALPWLARGRTTRRPGIIYEQGE